MKDVHMIVADNIKDARKEKGITQAELAEQADVSIDTIIRVEAGKPMSMDTFFRIANVLKANPAYMLCEDKKHINYQKQFEIITAGRDSGEMEYILFMVEKLLEGKDRYQG